MKEKKPEITGIQNYKTLLEEIKEVLKRQFIVKAQNNIVKSVSGVLS
jgi:hypothetical protein